MTALIRIIVVAALSLAAVSALAAGAASNQSPLNPAASAARSYPKIVLYSVSWCPHCMDAKEYLTTHKIPFINKDVEVDEAAMDELTKKYHSQAVPVIVIGTDGKTILRGFNQADFEKALKAARH